MRRGWYGRLEAESRITGAVAEWRAAPAEASNKWTVYYIVREEMNKRRITLARAAVLLVELGFATDAGVVRTRMRDTTLMATASLRSLVSHGLEVK